MFERMPIDESRIAAEMLGADDFLRAQAMRAELNQLEQQAQTHGVGQGLGYENSAEYVNAVYEIVDFWRGAKNL